MWSSTENHIDILIDINIDVHIDVHTDIHIEHNCLLNNAMQLFLYYNKRSEVILCLHPPPTGSDVTVRALL